MAVDMFLKLDGIDGESSDHKHKGEIEILSFSWGVSQTISSTGGGGGATGKVQVSDFSIVKQMGTSSPQLMERCCSGQHFPDATITLVNKETKQTFYVIKLSDCLISSYSTGGASGGGAVPVDQVSFNFRSMDLMASDKSGRQTQVSCGFQGGALVNGHNH
jgi:type VI secretion system secreted protein Hcp